MVVAVVLKDLIWVTILVVVGVLKLGVCCVVKVVVAVVMMVVMVVVVLGVTCNERATTTTINIITNTNTPETPNNQVNK